MPHQLPADLAAAVSAAETRLDGFNRIEYFPDIDSTNDMALAYAGRGAPHGTVVLADAQRAGRGRLGRAWHSPAEAGVYLSAILRADVWAGALSLVTLAAGVAVVRGLQAATGLAAELKWPNDVVVGRPWRKLAGILSESASASARVEAVIVGIGINLRSSAFPPELQDRATAVEMELGRSVDRATCVAEVLVALAEASSRLSAGDRDWVLAEWRRYGRACLSAAPVRWHDGHHDQRGTAIGIDETGALLVETGAGEVQRVISGEVSWERLSRV
jgi:BirA family biotin operon repressor/biotin-[acetyl-CoA-carboxylase] ligase